MKLPKNLVANKTLFTDLCLEVQLLIVEELDYPSLLQIAEINEYFSILATDVFRRKYSTRNITLADFSKCKNLAKVQPDIGLISAILTSIGKNPKKWEHSHCVFNDHIEIYQVEETLMTLKHFGHVIQQLNILYFNMEENDAKIIAEYIDKYCTKTLIHIGFASHYQSIFQYLNVPFQMVENVSFQNSISYIKNEALPMNDLFPVLRHLTLCSFESAAIDNFYIVSHLPHLEHLTFDAKHSYSHFEEIVQLIKKNPQIQSIDLKDITPRFLGSIASLLPNLKMLALLARFDNIDEIHFENVTKFEATRSLMAPENISFSNLDELWIKCDENQCDKWRVFVEKYRNLRRLHVRSSSISNDQFERLTNLPNLEDVSVFLLDEHLIGIETVVKFMESHGKLKSFQLNSCKEIDKEILYGKFQREWKIIDYEQCLSFERI